MKINKIKYAHHSNVAIGKNENYLFSKRYALQHFSSGAIYTFIPKNACSTMRYSLAVANGFIDKSTDPNWIHNNINSNSNLFHPSQKDIATSPYTFVILRCPYKRLASAFLDKAVDLKISFLRQCKEINPLINSKQEMLEFASDMTFSKFIASLTHLPHERLDEHFRNQIDFLFFEDYSAWFNLEDFSATKVKLEKDIGLITYDTRKEINHHTSGLELISGDYSNTTLKSIQNLKQLGQLPHPKSLFNENSKKLFDKYYHEDLKLYKSKFGSIGLLF